MSTSKELTVDRIAVMKAYVDGSEIQFIGHNKKGGKWSDVPFPVWDWSLFDYRIKPVPSEVYVVEGTNNSTKSSYMTGPYLAKENADKCVQRNNSVGWTYRIIKYREVLKDE